MYQSTARELNFEHNYNRFLTFKLHNDLYGIEVIKVKEVLYLCEIAFMQNGLPYMRGVIDLRGTAVPLVDLRIKFKVPEHTYDQYTVILVVEIHNVLIGFIVDQVYDVLNLVIENYLTPPCDSENNPVDCIVQNSGQLISILNINKIFLQEDVTRLKQFYTNYGKKIPKVHI